MRKILFLVLGASLIFYPFAGCSISAMNSKPSSLPIDTLKEHPTRSQLINVFGKPADTDLIGEVRTDYFSFTDGHHGATKLRALLYIAGCVFTLCLSELIFWPLEVNTMHGMKGTAVAVYDKDTNYRIARNLTILNEDGEPWDVHWQDSTETPTGEY